MKFTVADVPDRERFEARDETETLAGALTYQLTGAIIACTHTTVESGFPAPEVEAALARAAMDDSRARNRMVVPLCPILTAWLDRNPQYEKAVARSTRKVK
jgi:predicted GNAT family acetyltransferase